MSLKIRIRPKASKDYLSLSDAQLSEAYHQITSEIKRRSLCATRGYDSAASIFGNESAKRAIVIAALGNYSLLLIGPPNSGKTMLRGLAIELGLSQTFEARPCPCGYRQSLYRKCGCSIKKVEQHLRRLPRAIINI